jgi:hypothetical protein
LEAIAASTAADNIYALVEDEHLLHEYEIIQDLICIIDGDDGDDGVESSEEESSDNEGAFKRPMPPVDFGINPLNDDEPMQSLDAGKLLSIAAAVPTAAAPNVAGSATTPMLMVLPPLPLMLLPLPSTPRLLLELLSQGCPLDRFNSVKSEIVI